MQVISFSGKLPTAKQATSLAQKAAQTATHHAQKPAVALKKPLTADAFQKTKAPTKK